MADGGRAGHRHRIGIGSGLLPDFRRVNSFGASLPLDNPFGIAQLPAWWYPFFHGASLLSIIFLSMAGVLSMILRLKRSTGDERQQMKWLAYFLATAVTIQLLVFELPGNLFYPQIFRTIWYTLILLAVFWGFPLVIGLAIFKYRLYAIDLIIRRTLAYGLLTAILAVTFLGSVIVLQSLFATATGQQSPVIIVISTLLIAALFNPLRLRVQGWIDRRFFRRKYDAAQTLAAFAATARDEVDLDRLTQELVQVMQETMQPAHVSVWLKKSNVRTQSRQDIKS